MLVPTTRISFEHMIFLVGALSRGEELRLAGCRGCGALLVVERIGLREVLCGSCRSAVKSQSA
jgi:hypothetical protein